MLNTLKAKLLDRCSLGVMVTSSLRDAIADIKPDDYLTLTLLAHRIDACNDERNHWLASDLHNDDGELYDGGGRFWSCGSKLCPSCLAKQARRNRSRLREAIGKQKLRTGENLHFVTFTMPNPGLDLITTRSIMNRAWSLLRKRQYWKQLVKGGCKSEEFTVTAKGFHYHMHQILRAGFISYSKLKSEWTECLQKAALDVADHSMTFATSDKLAIVNVQRVRSVDSAIKEVAKYITKADAWSKLESSTLLDLARIRRFPRMFELFGTFALADTAERPSRASLEVSIQPLNNNQLRDIEAILDTQSISDGELFEPSWRGRANRVGAAEYLAELHQRIGEAVEIRKGQLKRKYHAATFLQVNSERPPLVPRTLEFIARIREAKQGRETLIKLDDGSLRYEHADGTVEWLDARRDAVRLRTIALRTLARPDIEFAYESSPGEKSACVA